MGRWRGPGTFGERSVRVGQRQTPRIEDLPIGSQLAAPRFSVFIIVERIGHKQVRRRQAGTKLWL